GRIHRRDLFTCSLTGQRPGRPPHGQRTSPHFHGLVLSQKRGPNDPVIVRRTRQPPRSGFFAWVKHGRANAVLVHRRAQHHVVRLLPHHGETEPGRHVPTDHGRQRSRIRPLRGQDEDDAVRTRFADEPARNLSGFFAVFLV